MASPPPRNPSDGSFAAFLAARRPPPTDHERQAARRVLRYWLPLILVILALTVEATPAGILARGIVIVAVLAEWLRLAVPLPALAPRWLLGVWLLLLGYSLGHALWRLDPRATWALLIYLAIVAVGTLRAWHRHRQEVSRERVPLF